MIALDFAATAAALGVESPSNGQFTGLEVDSRRIRPGMLFAALRGERVDGHDFATRAAQAGAVALLVERPVTVDLPQFVVADVLQALGRLASAWRSACRPRVAAITGSNGKTTTKEMLASILAMDGGVLATQGNYNNELGLPLTLFGLASDHRFAVLEMGASKAGDIRYLAGIAEPEAGVVTNVGPAHLKGFGDEEGVARAKGELYSSLPADGFAVINADEPWAPLWREFAGSRRVIEFSSARPADIHVAGGASGQQLHTPEGAFDLRLRLPGRHNVMNAMAAAGLALALDIPTQQIAAGLAATRPVPGRLNQVQTDHGWVVYDDTYNANPASLYAGLRVLTGGKGEPWLVLGDMRELGHDSRKMHAEMGEAASGLGVKRLFTFGTLSRATTEAFGEGARHFDDREALVATLLKELRPGVACLVKGSRSMAMEQVVEAITTATALKEAG